MINKEQNFSKQGDALQTLKHSDSGKCLEKGLWGKTNRSDDQVNKNCMSSLDESTATNIGC